MGLLTGLFQETVPELPVAAAVIEVSGSVEPGYLHRIAASDNPLTVTLLPHSVDTLSGKRFALKVYSDVNAPDGGGTLTVAVPEGQRIEGDDGVLDLSVMITDQALGLYREWLCDEAGNWFMVGRI